MQFVERKPVLWLFWAVCAAAVLRVVFLWAQEVALFLHPHAFVLDAQMYWTVGRATLEGYVPYQDVFEIKPPGAFVISAVSFALFKNAYLGNVLGALSLLAPVVLLVLAARGHTLQRTVGERATLMAFAIFGGLVLSTFIAVKGHPWQTEVFGALFAAVYVASLDWPYRRTRLRTVLATAGLLGAIACKEPFVFACFGAAVLSAKHPRDLLRSFLLPLLAALLLGALLGWLLGYLPAYLEYYLPALSYRGYAFGPLWTRSFRFLKLAENLSHISLLLPLTLSLTLFGAELYGTARSAKAVGMRCGKLAVALYVALLAVGAAGDYQAHHFVFFAPLFLAVLFRALGAASAAWQHSRGRVAVAGMTVLWALTALLVRGPSFSPYKDEDIARITTVATGIDTVLDRCSIDRYLLIRNDGLIPFGLTRHVPLNHALFWPIDMGLQYGQQFLDESIRRLSEAQVIVYPEQGFTSNNAIGDAMGAYIRQTFTEALPSCAGIPPALPGYGLLFRVSDKPFTKTFEFALPPKP